MQISDDQEKEANLRDARLKKIVDTYFSSAMKNMHFTNYVTLIALTQDPIYFLSQNAIQPSAGQRKLKLKTSKYLSEIFWKS